MEPKFAKVMCLITKFSVFGASDGLVSVCHLYRNFPVQSLMKSTIARELSLGQHCVSAENIWYK